MIYDTIIIGGGVASFGAAIYSARFGMKTLILAARLGGLIQDTHIVENYPGFKAIGGGELAKTLLEHVKSYDVKINEEVVVDIKKSAKYFKVKTDKSTYLGKTIICATGTRHRELGIKGEAEFKNKGVSYCAVCDGPLFKDKVVGIVGGADSAAKEALFLSKYAKKVFIIYRKEKIRAEPIDSERVAKTKNIEIVNNTNVVEIKGASMMESVVLDDGKEMKLDGLFIAVGQAPHTDLAKKVGVKLNSKGEIKINRLAETNIPGFFAAGDCVDDPWKQAIIGVAEGCTAAFSAYEFLK